MTFNVPKYINKSNAAFPMVDHIFKIIVYFDLYVRCVVQDQKISCL